MHGNNGQCKVPLKGAAAQASERKGEIIVSAAVFTRLQPDRKIMANMKRYLRDNIHNYKFVDSAIYDYFGYSVI